MSGFNLRASLAKWRRREKYRKARHAFWERRGNPVALAHWSALLRQARAMIERRRAQLSPPAPAFKTAAQIGLSFTYPWGNKGPVTKGGGHYSAGSRARNLEELERLARGFHEHHKAQGWGGMSYEVLIADDGSMIFGNPMDRKSAAIASMNTGMVSICCPGTTGDRLTAGQKKSIGWLMDNWHTAAVPSRHRLPVRARSIPWRGHREWNNSTACPGSMLADYHEAWS